MRVLPFLVVAVALLAGCNQPPPQVAPNPVTPCGALDPTFEPDERYSPVVTLRTGQGELEVALYHQQVQLTAGNFLQLVTEDFFDGTRFHILQEDVLVAGGDPLSASDNKNFWGTGGPGYTIPDDFHQFLRNDRAGIVSMLSAGPGKGGSVFAINLVPRPDFDDRQAVFGRVIEGLDVVRQLSATPVDDRSRPEHDAQLFSATVAPPEVSAAEAEVALSAFGFDCDQRTTAGSRAEFLVAVRNTGQRLLKGTFTTEAPEGWSAALRNADSVTVSSGQTIAYIVDVSVPATAPLDTTGTVTVIFGDEDSPAVTSLGLTVRVGELGASPERGQMVRIDYVGVLEDGRPFDTTVEAYAALDLGWFRPPPTDLKPLPPFELGGGQFIRGFDQLADRARLGESVVGSIAPEDGYGAESYGTNNLGGRLLIFQLQVVSIGE